MKVKQCSRPKNIPKAPYVFILTHQHIKNAPGKLMNILLNPPLRLSQTEKKIKSPHNKDAGWAHSRALPGLFLGMNFSLPPQL